MRPENSGEVGCPSIPLFEEIIDDLAKQHFCVKDDFFTIEEVDALRDSLALKFDENRFKKSAIGNRTHEMVKKAIRGDLILWINETEQNEAEALFFRKINTLVDYLNRTCFMGILHKEFHYALYPPGTFYKKHLDSFQNDNRRKLSVVCYLNDENWAVSNGGELVIYTDENNPEIGKTIYPFPGRVVIFESQVLEHEVKKVSHSARLSITGWLKTR